MKLKHVSHSYKDETHEFLISRQGITAGILLVGGETNWASKKACFNFSILKGKGKSEYRPGKNLMLHREFEICQVGHLCVEPKRVWNSKVFFLIGKGLKGY